ncbi:MAG TPA: sialidase family protein [Candidatus Dormibacteraeota bacterium]
MRILAATGSGLVTLDPDTGQQSRQLEGHRLSALAPAGRTRLWAAVDRREIWRNLGGGWEPVAQLPGGLEVTCLADTRANAEDGILAGTSKARLGRVTPAGLIEFVEAFDHAPGREDWFTPWGGPPGTRTLSEDRDTVYANVHVGGVLRSRDEGATWEPTIDIEADVHQVATGPGRVYAAGAQGLSISEDRGETWRTLHEGLHAAYCRAVAVCGEWLLLSASDGPGAGRAAIYRSDPAGSRFERCRRGLPEWFQGNVDSLCLDALPKGDLAAFATESGEVYASNDQGASWSPIGEGFDSIRRLLVLP